ncbi:hypothetical protein PUNSTDRAFT_52817 [Punctularia strigosozonata HHB-11173 SS5]|uniref:uncharacterized protein n=1 Tax=Punctularia strigosozonata (strain HHB-11173) TaxID=741275 RepID=UPI0004417323|nr:uncharacterized protein PUNSTDRAFT_52817 [Punctularia strigosozonata HHB-11173 SS5]EIN08387.1 hypothetical protein PUNSTDRAFT_52817 [Punctularia strigosozonata HHB-11173 SS5]
MPHDDTSLLSRRQNGGDSLNENPVMFAILLVFLGAFMFFLAGGIAWHAIVGRRRGRLITALAELRFALTQENKPELWDAWADRTQSRARAEWRTTQPLAVNAISPREGGDLVDLMDWDLPLELLLHRVRGGNRWWPMSLHSLLPNLSREQIRQLMKHGRISPADEDSLPRTKEPPTNTTGVQVALVIAMPVPPKLKEDEDNAKSDDAHLLRDFVIGTTCIPL